MIKICRGRNYFKGKPYAHVVWNEHNPDTPAEETKRKLSEIVKKWWKERKGIV